MASVGSASGGSRPSYREADIEAAVTWVTTVTPEHSNLDEALKHEEIAAYSYAQLAEIDFDAQMSAGIPDGPSRAIYVACFLLSPLCEAVLSIFALGKFLTGHAFWTSQTLSQERGMPLEARLKKRFTAWGKDLYEGVVQHPVTAVIGEIACFTGIIAPRLPRKFAAALRAVSLVSTAVLRTRACEVQGIVERSRVDRAVAILREATSNPRVIQQIQDIKKTDSTISADAIAKEILRTSPNRIAPAPSGKGEA